MHLVNSNYALLIFIPFALLMALIIFGQIRKVKLTNRIFSSGQKHFLLANYSQSMRIIRLACLILALFFISFSVLDPRWGSRSVDKTIEGIDVVIAMDISQSMETPDMIPDRLGYSQELAQQLLSLLVGNRVGISAFAGYGFKVIPLTMDVNAAIIFLNELSTTMIDVQGTNLEDAIKKAMELFQEETLTHKAIVVFTDGEDTEFDPMTQVEKAQKQGITIFTVGIGTPEGGIIPLYDDSGEVYGYMENEDGEQVVSQLNEELLKEMAETTGGSYYEGNEQSIISLGNELDKIKKSEFGSNIYEYMQPQYQYFLAIGLLLLLIYLFLPDRKPRVKVSSMVMILFMFIPAISFASPATDGVESYRSGDFESALDYFQQAIAEKPENSKIRFNEANAYYQLEDYAHAISGYSMISADDEDLQQKIWYNMGNSYFQMQEVDSAINLYKKVIDSADPESFIFEKAVNNFILAKEMKSNASSTNDQGDQQDSQEGDEEQDSQSDQEQNQEDQEDSEESEQQEGDEEQDQEDQQQQDGDQSEEESDDEVSPISPTDVENLLNLIEEEEKQHLSEQEQADGFMIRPQKEW